MAFDFAEGSTNISTNASFAPSDVESEDGGERAESAETDSSKVKGSDRNTVRREDYYSTVGGTIVTADVDGRPILYSTAQDDYDALSQEIIALGTYYISRNAGRSAGTADTSNTNTDARARPKSAGPSKKGRAGSTSINSVFDEKAFRQMPVDRGAVLLDAWMCEAE